ncbi:MAG: hypothetical protein HFH14_03505 [Lachnospiraceae bacterium]|nr:hypothetical protein [Lachnospiraceae bacterium]
MGKSIKNIIYKVFWGIFFCAFLAVFCKVLFADNIHNNKPGILILWMLVGTGIAVLAYYLLNRFSVVIKKYYKIILAVFLVIYGITVVVNGFLLRFTPAFDMDAIYGGAIQWIEKGTFFDYHEYFGYFPNNLGAMTVLHFVFSIASVFGVSDYFAVGIIFNSFIIIMTVLVVSLVCRKLMGEVAGVMALVFFMLCVPFLVMGAAFYTDSLSVLFPALFYYLYLKFREQETLKKRLIYSVLMGLALAVGMLIKFTVLIILVAVVIDALLSVNWKNVCLFTACSLFIAFITFGIMNTYMYYEHLDKETCDNLKTPYLHWVMMGMQNNGYYNPGDYEFTRSLAPEDRNKACLNVIKERIGGMGLSGMAELFMNKAAVCFGDGTYALSDFLDDTPANETWLHKYVLYDGEKYVSYRYFTTGQLLVVYLLMLLGAVRCLMEKGLNRCRTLAPSLAALGILSFLLLWETSGRYFTNFVPLMIICAVLSFGWKKGGKEDV